MHNFHTQIPLSVKMKAAKKVAKGYRLKPETHKMIKQIQKYVRGSVDDSVNLACRRLLNEIKNNLTDKGSNNFIKIN